MEARMKTSVLATKLRARLVVLKKDHAVSVAKYDAAFEQWKTDVAAWAQRDMPARVAALKKSEVVVYSRSALPESVFRGIPTPPPIPSRERIEKIQKTLRFVALTGQQTISVSQREVDDWLGNGGM